MTKEWELATEVTDQQVDFYQQNGYLTFGRIFTKAELDQLYAYVDQMIVDLPENKRPEQMDTPHFQHPFLFNYLAHPRVLDVIEQFIGPDIVLWSSHLISKRCNDGLAVPWHQDGVYWGNRLEPMDVITMWLAVDASQVENGCMRVIAGSHRDQDLRYQAVATRSENLFGSEVVTEDRDPSKIVDLELAVGECHFHKAFTIHSSNANTSQQRRCGYTMRYMPASVRCNDAKANLSHQIYLLRGQDLTSGYNRYSSVPSFLA